MAEKKKKRGMGSMSPEKQREIASLGGRASHQGGFKADGTPRRKSHEWTSDEARERGRKGGMASRGGRGKVETSTPSTSVDLVPDQSGHGEGLVRA